MLIGGVVNFFKCFLVNGQKRKKFLFDFELKVFYVLKFPLVLQNKKKAETDKRTRRCKTDTVSLVMLL